MAEEPFSKHPTLAARLSGLAESHWERYRHSEDLADLEPAIEVARRAVAATPAGDPDLPARQRLLAQAYQCRYRHTQEPADLVLAKDVAAAQARGGLFRRFRRAR